MAAGGCGQILQAKTGWIEACLPCSPSREMAAEKEVNRGEGSIGETCRNPKMLTVFFLNVGDVIVTTPHSLVRLLTYRSLLFLRLCHLVLDEVQVLFFEANEQVSVGTLVPLLSITIACVFLKCVSSSGPEAIRIYSWQINWFVSIIYKSVFT